MLLSTVCLFFDTLKYLRTGLYILQGGGGAMGRGPMGAVDLYTQKQTFNSHIEAPQL